MKLPEKQLILINGLLFTGLCILTGIAVLETATTYATLVALVAGPVLLFISSVIGSWLLAREIRKRKKTLDVLREAIDGRLLKDPAETSGQLAQLVSLLWEEQTRIRRILADHGETATLVNINLDRVIRLIDQMAIFIHDIDKLSSRIQHLYRQLDDSLLQAGNREDLSETILKIRFELDHFNEVPSAMLNLLKQIYASYHQKRAALINAHEGLLGTQSIMAEGEINIIADQQKALQDMSDAVQNLGKALHLAETSLQEGDGILREVTTRFQDFSRQVNEVHTLSSELPEQIRSLSTLMTELEDVHDKSKILALNAAIYAGDAGEEGKGFSTIAREMKTLTESAEALQTRLQQELNQLEKAALHTLGGVQQLISTESAIRTFSEESHQKYHISISDKNTGQESETTLNETLCGFAELVDSQQKSVRERQTLLSKALASTRKSQQESTDEREQKFQIDNMVIESARFTEKIESELPLLLNAVGGILDEVSAFQDQFLQTRNALAGFTDPRIMETLKDLKQAMDGRDVQLLKTSTNLLRKMKSNIPSN